MLVAGPAVVDGVVAFAASYYRPLMVPSIEKLELRSSVATPWVDQMVFVPLAFQASLLPSVQLLPLDSAPKFSEL